MWLFSKIISPVKMGKKISSFLLKIAIYFLVLSRILDELLYHKKIQALEITINDLKYTAVLYSNFFEVFFQIQMFT